MGWYGIVCMVICSKVLPAFQPNKALPLDTTLQSPYNYPPPPPLQIQGDSRGCLAPLKSHYKTPPQC